jgi:hypothetical protein
VAASGAGGGALAARGEAGDVATRAWVEDAGAAVGNNRSVPLRPFVLVACALFLPDHAFAQASAPVPAVIAERLGEDERLELDGRLDEDGWRRAQPVSEFRQQEPGEGEAPTERTEVRVLYSERALYIGAMMYDSDPSGIKGFQKRRDAGLGSDDRFMWILDTFLDGRSAYFFEINPAGLMGDGLLRQGSGNNLNKSWDGVWLARVSRHAELQSGSGPVGDQLPAHDPPQERRAAVERLAAHRRAVSALDRRAPDGTARPHAGARSGTAPLSLGVAAHVGRAIRRRR